MNAQRISDRRMPVRGTVTALVCGCWLLANLAAGQEAESPRPKASMAEAQRKAVQDPPMQVRVYELKYAEAASLVELLASLGITDDKRTKVDADVSRNRLLVSAPPEQLKRVTKFIDIAEKKSAKQDDQRVTQIYNLKYAKAASLAELLSYAMAGTEEEMQIVPDERLNVIIVLASREQQERVKGLVNVLDAPPARDVAHEYEHKIFKLVHAQARDLAEVISTLLGPDGKIAVDQRTNSILVQAPPDTLAVIEAALTKLDEEADKDLKKYDPESTLQIRVVWLASGLSGDDGAEPPDDLENVLDPLRPMGVKNLRQVGQVIVNTTPDGEFQVRCSPVLDQRPSDLEISGMFDQQQETPTLNIQLSATQTESASEKQEWRTKQLVDLETKIVAPLGHYVVLGVAPVEHMTSVFVVQITAGKK